jgi:hypothetical protein
MGYVPPKTWTDEERAELRRLWRDDVPIPVMAEMIGCTYSQIDLQRRKLGLPPRAVGQKSKGRSEGGASYWAGAEARDAAFAALMAGRKHESVDVPPDPRRMARAVYDPGVGASSMELNA